MVLISNSFDTLEAVYFQNFFTLCSMHATSSHYIATSSHYISDTFYRQPA